jgi:O-antigen ligase
MTLHLTAWTAALFLAVSMFGSSVALRLLLLLMAAALALAAVLRNGGTLQRLPPVWLPFCAWAVWAALSLVWSIEPERSLKELRNEMFYAALALWACFIGAQVRQAAKIMMPTIAAGAVAVCAVAVYHFTIAMYYLQGDFTRYLSGWHGGPGAHSSVLLVLLPLGLMTVWYAAEKRVRWLALAGIAISLLFLASAYTTLNRAVFLAMGVQLAMMAGLVVLRQHGFSKRAIGRAAVIGMLFLATAAVAVLYLQGRRVELGGRQLEADTRLLLWPKVFSLISERPWTGYGFGRGLLREPLGQVLGTQDPNLWHAHNLVLEALLQLGVPGLMLLLWLLGATVRVGWLASRKDDRRTAACGIALVAIVAGMIVRNMTDTLFVRQSALLYWGVVAVLLAWCRPASDLPPLYSGTQPRSRARTEGASVSAGSASQAFSSASSSRFPGVRALATRSLGCGVGRVRSVSASGSS